MERNDAVYSLIPLLEDGDDLTGFDANTTQKKDFDFSNDEGVPQLYVDIPN